MYLVILDNVSYICIHLLMIKFLGVSHSSVDVNFQDVRRTSAIHMCSNVPIFHAHWFGGYNMVRIPAVKVAEFNC